MRILTDEPKRLSNLDKHGLDFDELTLEFFESAVTYPAKRGRFRAVGNLDREPPWTVIFSVLGTEAISVVSMRYASRKERKDARKKASE